MEDPIFGKPELGSAAPAPAPDETEGLSAIAGESKSDGQKPDDDAMVAALREVYDPEIPVNIYDLGLIYNLDTKDNGDVDIQMTLTTPGCPVAGEMPQWVADSVSMVPNTGKVSVTLTWEPPWTLDQMTDDAKLALGLI
jgi:FeS assembly SUF system protein